MSNKKKSKRVSLIIPAYNEEDSIGNLLKSLMKQTYKPHEIIVVDDGSTDNTVMVARRFPVKIIRGQHKGCGPAKNLGWKKARGDVIIFLDADMVVGPNYIKETVKCYDNPIVGGTAHVEKPLNKKPNFIARMLYLRKFLGSTWKPLFVKSVRGDILERIGPYDSDFGFYDDWELGTRIENGGLKMAWSKGDVWHEDIESLNSLFKQCRWMGRSVTFKRYKINALKKILYTILITGLPLYILFLFFDQLRYFGIFGLVLFSVVEMIKTLKILYYSKKFESLLTFIFDYMTATFNFIGMIDKLINSKLKSVRT